ncbi:MAG: hypothetical protein LUC86_04430 [Prevotellaceae bacterium]|nr:hypothetical protein [Prevotellaceae bacterium]
MEDKEREIDILQNDKAPEGDKSEVLHKEELFRLAAENYSQQNEMLRERQSNLIQDREQRKKYASRIFWMICVYLVLILIVVFSCGWGLMALNDGVLMMLLGTTTANVIGLFAIVTKYLFHPTVDSASYNSR